MCHFLKLYCRTVIDDVWLLRQSTSSTDVRPFILRYVSLGSVWLNYSMGSSLYSTQRCQFSGTRLEKQVPFFKKWYCRTVIDDVWLLRQSTSTPDAGPLVLQWVLLGPARLSYSMSCSLYSTQRCQFSGTRHEKQVPFFKKWYCRTVIDDVWLLRQSTSTPDAGPLVLQWVLLGPVRLSYSMGSSLYSSQKCQYTGTAHKKQVQFFDIQL